MLITLETAHKEKHGRLVLGRAGRDAGGKLEGWHFSPQGVKWIKENEKRILAGLKQNERVLAMPERDRERFIKKLKVDPLFKLYQEKKSLNEASQYMFTDMLVCAPANIFSDGCIENKWSLSLINSDKPSVSKMLAGGFCLRYNQLYENNNKNIRT